MAKVIGVRFKRAGKIYYFDPDQWDAVKGSNVIVETVRGVEFGEVVLPAREVEEAELTAPLKKVIRIATEQDQQTMEKNAEKAREAFAICEEKILKHQLEMKLVDVEYTFDNNKIIFYFTADGRVDFRELVKDLASVFRVRIELRQIGVRDEAKMLGGLGSCGRPCCCSQFLGEFQPVSIKMAKEQNLSLSPTKISGLCGRLMCCLKYEQDYYESMSKCMVRAGKSVVTPDGTGVVLENNALTGTAVVRVELADGTLDLRSYHYTDVKPLARQGAGPVPERRPEPPPQEAEEESISLEEE